MTARRLARALPLLAAALLMGCSEDASPEAAADRSSAAPSSTAPATPAPAQPTVEPVVATPAEAAPLSWPAEVEYPVEGPAWVVYIAVAEDGSQAEQDRVWAAMAELRAGTPYVTAGGAAA